MKKYLKISVIAAVVVLIQSCGVNSNWMLKTPRDYEFADIDSLNETKDQYRLDINDILKMRFFTNDGNIILELSSNPNQATSSVTSSEQSLSYTIQSDSMVRMPSIGEINLVGLTIREAETTLEENYQGIYIDPFIQLIVTNRRVVVFPGDGGDAQVLYLNNTNNTLMEVLALAGGVTERGRASRIKLVRKNDDGKREVYKIDLSTIEGLEYTDLQVQANDYIYVDPVPEIGNELLKEITPVVSLISSAAVILAIILTP